MNFSKLKQHPVVFSRIFGLPPEKLNELVAMVASLWRKAETKRLKRPDRKVKPGAGRPHALALEDQIAMLLLYARSYVTHVFLGALFDVHDSRVMPVFRPGEAGGGSGVRHSDQEG